MCVASFLSKVSVSVQDNLATWILNFIVVKKIVTKYAYKSTGFWVGYAFEI